MVLYIHQREGMRNMREVITYVAYDGEEFETIGECLAYERKALKCLSEIYDKYTLFDENMTIFIGPVSSTDVEEWLCWLRKAFDKCKTIYREENLSEDAEIFINNYCGYCMTNRDFDDEIGWFEYDMEIYEWVKVV